MIPWHIIDGECFKRKFGSENSAVRFAHGKALYAYQCSGCGAWHVSSRVADGPQPIYDMSPISQVSPEADYWLHRIKKPKSKKVRKMRV